MELGSAKAIDAPPELIFEFLEQFDRHLELIRERVGNVSAWDTGSQITLRGPLGIRRTVRTTLTYCQRPHSIVGRVRAGEGTHGTVRWSIQRSGRGSWVEVTARADSPGLLDRALLLFGGRRWLARSLELALEALGERMHEQAPELAARRLPYQRDRSAAG